MQSEGKQNIHRTTVKGYAGLQVLYSCASGQDETELYPEQGWLCCLRHGCAGSRQATLGLFSSHLKVKPGVVAHACNPSTWEAETGGSGFTASLSYLVRPPQLSETLFQSKGEKNRAGGVARRQNAPGFHPQ